MRYPELIDPRVVDTVRNARIAPRRHFLPSPYAGAKCLTVIGLAVVAFVMWTHL